MTDQVSLLPQVVCLQTSYSFFHHNHVLFLIFSTLKFLASVGNLETQTVTGNPEGKANKDPTCSFALFSETDVLGSKVGKRHPNKTKLEKEESCSMKNFLAYFNESLSQILLTKDFLSNWLRRKYWTTEVLI